MAEHASALSGPTIPQRCPDGEIRSIGMLDQDGKAFYAQWCVGEAYDSLLRLEDMVRQGRMRPEHYGRLQDRFTDNVMAHGFDWGGSLWQGFIDSRPGRVQLFLLSIQRRHRDFAEAEAAQLYDGLPAKEAARLTQFILAGPPADPNAPAAAASMPAAA